MAIEINYPATCNTLRRQFQFCIRFQEVLRKLHNGFGKWYTQGISNIAYERGIALFAHYLNVVEYPQANIETIKNQIRTKYPYVPQISEAVWQQFKIEDFKPRQNILSAILPVIKQGLKDELEWSEDLPEV